MQNYEDKEMFFDYTNKEEWIQYIKNSIIPLWEYSYILKEFFEELKIEFNEVNFSGIPKGYRPLLLGGFVQSDEKFRSNSLAEFYLNYFGLDMNRNLWKMQESLPEKVEEIQIIVRESEFIEFVKEIYSLLEYGLDLQQLVESFNTPVLNYEELIKEPNKVKDLVSNFYKYLLDILDYKDLDELSIEFEKRRVYGDPRDFEVFDGKADKDGKNCVVSEFSGYTYPELVGDPKNKRSLSIKSIKDAFREFIRFKVAHAPEGTIYERINVNKPTFHDVKNSMMVSLKSYQMMIEGRKIEYFKTKDVYEKNPKLAKLLKISQEKSEVIKKLNEGKMSKNKAVKNATVLQAQITDLESAFIKEHVESHIGKIQNTITDNEIPQVPLKLHVIPPNDQRPFGALVTSGMSAYAMIAPNMAEPTTAELFMLLSPDWPLPPETNKKDEFYWPVDRLLDMVKYVHGSRQWFSLGHTFGNGHPPKPFAKNTELCALLFKFPYKALPPTFCELMIGRKPVYFLQVMPIYREEMDYLMGNSPEEFATIFVNSGVSEYTELERVNLCSGKAFNKRSKGTFCTNCGTIIRDVAPNKKDIKCKQCGESISLN